jgi:hypothetical protein
MSNGKEDVVKDPIKPGEKKAISPQEIDLRRQQCLNTDKVFRKFLNAQMTRDRALNGLCMTSIIAEPSETKILSRICDLPDTWPNIRTSLSIDDDREVITIPKNLDPWRVLFATDFLCQTEYFKEALTSCGGLSFADLKPHLQALSPEQALTRPFSYFTLQFTKAVLDLIERAEKQLASKATKYVNTPWTPQIVLRIPLRYVDHMIRFDMLLSWSARLIHGLAHDFKTQCQSNAKWRDLDATSWCVEMNLAKEADYLVLDLQYYIALNLMDLTHLTLNVLRIERGNPDLHSTPIVTDADLPQEPNPPEEPVDEPPVAEETNDAPEHSGPDKVAAAINVDTSSRHEEDIARESLKLIHRRRQQTVQDRAETVVHDATPAPTPTLDHGQGAPAPNASPIVGDGDTPQKKDAKEDVADNH